ncbi:MAG: hypothetical protein U0800_21555 [Isosphaeraceae bacterium]
MAAKRGSSKAPTGPGSAGSTPPILNAVLLILAAAYGIWLLVSRGKLSWPPHDLLAGSFTLAGCVALAGPIILTRRDAAEGGGVGELAWMVGGLLIWIHDLVGALRGEYRSATWPTPIASSTLGLTMMAVVLAGWRLRGGSRGWAWTNVVGWVLAIFWVGMGIFALWPGRGAGLAVR